jgi:hypothetical protein
MNEEASSMIYRPTNQGKLFCLVAAIALFCVSCGNKSNPIESDSSNVNNSKCVIELSGTLQQCDLSKNADDRIVWKNSSATGLYACVDPQNTPFQAYGWYVPGNGAVRLSGKIRKDVAASSVGVVYYSSPEICVWPPPKSILTSPIIIIHAAE